jgi:hypothetical protein
MLDREGSWLTCDQQQRHKGTVYEISKPQVTRGHDNLFLCGNIRNLSITRLGPIFLSMDIFHNVNVVAAYLNKQQKPAALPSKASEKLTEMANAKLKDRVPSARGTSAVS